MDNELHWHGTVEVLHQSGVVVVTTTVALSKETVRSGVGGWHGVVGANLFDQMGRTLTLRTGEDIKAQFLVVRIVDEYQTEIQGSGPAPF